MCAAVWWPSFVLGAWGTLFFDQLLTVWVIATAGLVVVLVQPRSVGRRWPRVLALLIPSLWLVLGFLDDDGGNVSTALIDLLGILVGIVGVPFTLWTVVRVLWPELFTDLRLRARFGALLTVFAIVVASFLLGANQNRFLTCQDFEISGNTKPPGCVQAPASDDTMIP